MPYFFAAKVSKKLEKKQLCVKKDWAVVTKPLPFVIATALL
jgi:hypothetical protein